MKRSLPAAAAAAAAMALSCSVASAALLLRVEDVFLAAPPVSEVVREVEVYFTETGPPENENLASYFLTVRLDNGSSSIVMVPPAMKPTVHPWVLPASTGATEFGSDAEAIRFATDPAEGQNIDNNEGVLKFSVRIPAGTPLGVYPMTIDGPSTTFTNSTGNDILFPVDNGAVMIGGVPEPASLAVLGLGGGLMMMMGTRRRCSITDRP